MNFTFDLWNKNLKTSERSADKGTPRVLNDSASGILKAALTLLQTIQRLKISSKKRFVSAQNCFKASRERASNAFNNKSLSIKNRIMACKLRVAARILELGLEHLEAAVTACLLSLEELHGLPAIQGMFTVFFEGGLKSMINKSERLQNMMSILFINRALYDFATKYSSISRFPKLAFPGVELKARLFHQILNAHEVMTKTCTSGESFHELKPVDISLSVYVRSFAVNSCGDIILLDDDKITVIYSTGEIKDVMFPDSTEKNVLEHHGSSVAVDSNDNAYAIRRRRVGYENGTYKYAFVLYTLDENDNINNVCVLDFLCKDQWLE